MRFRVFYRWLQNRNRYVKIVKILQNFRNAAKASIYGRGWFAMCFWSFRKELERFGSSTDTMKKKTNLEHDIGDASYTCRSAGSPSVENQNIEREGNNLRKRESSTRPPRGDQVDGLPRVVNPGKLSPNAKQPGLQNFVVFLKIWKVSRINFLNREQILNLQVRRSVWFGPRLRLCVLDCCPGGLKTEIALSKLSKFCKIFGMHQTHL